MKHLLKESLDLLPIEMKNDLLHLRRLIKKYKPKEVKESFEDGQLIYRLPLKYFSDSYNGRPLLYAALAGRKKYISLNLICIFNDKNYRPKFAKKIMATGTCVKATGCCYQIKKVNPELVVMLSSELRRMNLQKFITTFEKFRQ